VLTGKAQHVYASLCPNTQDYGVVTSAILRAYELVPEAYRQRFRAFRKSNSQTYVEFAREKELLFDRWCAAEKVDNGEKMRDLILLEEFKAYCLPDNIAMYINEQKVTKCSEATVLADEFVLPHKTSFNKPSYPMCSGEGKSKGSFVDKPIVPSSGDITKGEEEVVKRSS